MPLALILGLIWKPQGVFQGFRIESRTEQIRDISPSVAG